MKPVVALLVVLAGGLVAGSPAVAFADEPVEIANWTAAPYWAPRATGTPVEQPEGPGADSHGRLAQARRALAGGPAALPFISLPPCRLVDTRGNGAPLTGGFLPSATVRSYTLTGVCNVPANAQAISLNATVVKPTGPGFLTLWPEGGAFPPVSTLNYLGNDVIVNAAVVPLSATGGISMALGVSGGDVILDTNGYYAPQALVSTLNTLSGDVALAQGTNVTITPSGNTLTIAATGVVTSITGTNHLSASPSTGAVTVTSDATFSNTASTIVSRDGSGNFSAGTITASLTGAASANVLKAGDTMTGTLTVNPGNINLSGGLSTASTGNILKNGSRFIHNFGDNGLSTTFNTFVGLNSGNFTMTGAGNNTAIGANALQSNISGDLNVASGVNALFSNTTGFQNTASGVNALFNNTTGNSNIAVGANAGLNLSTGSDNIYIGADAGSGSESRTIRIGTPGPQIAAYLAGVYGQTSASGVAVYVNGFGLLGTATSSRRFKRDIRDMGESSAGLFQLRPVSFRYTPDLDPTVLEQYGLIAEEVAQVYPDLVVYDADGQPQTVRYHFLVPMLLNEVQKQRQTMDNQSRVIERQSHSLEELRGRLEDQGRQLEALRQALESGRRSP